uniref:UPAR/Ly6 domain-containing protein n=1 Tax=Salarias fasciatus TaxID=181472 RepID=A0A672HY15_SALFA
IPVVVLHIFVAFIFTVASSCNLQTCVYFLCSKEILGIVIKFESYKNYILFLIFSVSSQWTTETLKGCASQEICYRSNIPGLEEPVQVHKCCQGDFCNSASSTSAGLLLSVVPLISLVLFS